MNSSRGSNPKTLETDIVVIGGGLCGMAAAVAAAEKKVRVTLLEKMGGPGGNSAFVVGIFGAETPAQRRLQIDTPKDELFKRQMAFSHWKTNPRIFRAFLDKSAETIQWLEEKGLTFDNIPPLYHQGHTIRTWHSFKNENASPVILKRLREICQELGVEMVFHCTAKRILTVDKTEVIGVLAEKKGEEMRMNAKNVIIATGGYGGNKELLKKYRPSYTEDMVYLGVPHLKGDGLRMAFEVGAANEGLGTLILHPHFSQGPEAVTGIAQEPSTLWVNKMGE